MVDIQISIMIKARLGLGSIPITIDVCWSINLRIVYWVRDSSNTHNIKHSSNLI